MNRDVRSAVLESVALAAAAAVSFWLTKRVLLRVDSISHADDLVGGMWAVIATVVVCRSTDQEKATAAASRSVGTLVGLVLCLGYLLIFPFHALGLVTLIGLSALVVTLIGRPDAVGVAAITTAVLLVLAAVNPHDAWEQPILRGADTAIGIAVGLGAAWTARVARTVSAAARAARR